MASLIKQHWKDVAIERTQAITDAWEVFKIIMGRLAEWILFVTMILNIVEMFPGISFWVWAANGIMLIQVVTLDVAGFGLASMADHAQACGHEAEAKHAHWVARLLIGIMIVTLLLVTAGVLFGSNKDLVWLKPWLGYGEDILIFARIIMVVLYGHTIHKLRETTAVHTPSVSALDEIARLQQSLDHATQSLADMQAKSNQNEAEWRLRIAVMQDTLSTLEASKIATERALESLQDAHKNAPENDTESDTENATEDDTEHDLPIATNITLLRTQKHSDECQKKRTKTHTPNDSEKAAKAKRYIRRNATMSATELAQKAQISVSYARRLLSENRAEKEA